MHRLIRAAIVLALNPAASLLCLGLLVAMAGCRGDADGLTTTAPSSASLPARRRPAPNPTRNAYFGEQHLHTAYSLDAYIGGARLTPSDAYRFAKGEEVEVGGVKVRIDAPLDWAAVTDHAEYLGEMHSTVNTGAPGHDNPQLEELRSLTSIEERERWFLEYVQKPNRGATPRHAPFFAGNETTASGWKVVLDAAEEHYAPGEFTTIPAFEWSAAPQGGNLHRNVFFRDMNVPERPMSYVDINRKTGSERGWRASSSRGCMSSRSPTTPTRARA